MRQTADVCLRDASNAAQQEIEPALLITKARTYLAGRFQVIKDYFHNDINQPPAHEYGIRPSRESLAEVSRYLDERLTAAITPLGRGRLDDRLKPRVSFLGPVLQRRGGGHRVGHYVVAALLMWALWQGL